MLGPSNKEEGGSALSLVSLSLHTAEILPLESRARSEGEKIKNVAGRLALSGEGDGKRFL